MKATRSRTQAATYEMAEVVCWTRMQAEAGQPLEHIIARKEAERRASSGTFFWGVGNAPHREARGLANRQAGIPVIFSIMKTPPHPRDRQPDGLLLWRKYIDHLGITRDIPDTSLVTSRKKHDLNNPHYALICSSPTQLVLGDYGPFDNNAYRNMGLLGKSLAFSQVTALAEKVSRYREESAYRANLLANLTGGYWVRLLNPAVIFADKQDEALTALSNFNSKSTKKWSLLVKHIASLGTELPQLISPAQQLLFA